MSDEFNKQMKKLKEQVEKTKEANEKLNETNAKRFGKRYCCSRFDGN